MSMDFSGSASAQQHGALQSHAEFVTARMLEMGANIEQLALMLEQAHEQSRGLAGRLDALRQRKILSSEQLTANAAGPTAADHATAQQRDAQAIKEALASLTLEVAGLRERFTAALTQLQKLQNETLPTARQQDYNMAAARLEDELQRLEVELEQQKQELKKISQDHTQVRRVATEAVFAAQPGAQAAEILHMMTAKGSLLSSEPKGESEHVSVSQTQEHQGANPEANGELLQIVKLMTQAVQTSGKVNVADAKTGSSTTPITGVMASLQSRWASYLTKRKIDGWVDVNQLIQHVMREAYVSSSEDLKMYAQKLKFHTDLKAMLRDELKRARSFLSEHTADREKGELDTPFEKLKFELQPQVDANDALVPKKPEADGTTTHSAELNDYIKELDQMLNTVGDDAQLAQIDLQNMTQRVQQAVQMLSTLSKLLHETAMAIIRKIGS